MFGKKEIMERLCELEEQVWNNADAIVRLSNKIKKLEKKAKDEATK